MPIDRSALLPLVVVSVAASCTTVYQVESPRPTEVSRGRGAGEGLLVGAGIGAVLGAVAGLLDGNRDCDDCFFRLSRAETVVFGAVAIGVAGAGLGAIVGAIRGHRDVYEVAGRRDTGPGEPAGEDPALGLFGRF